VGPGCHRPAAPRSRLTDELAKSIAEQARAQGGASGSGFFGQLGAQLKPSFAVGQRYCAMAPEAILAETPGNWALLPGQVGSITVERKSRPEGEDGPDFDFVKDHDRGGGGKGTYETDDDRPGQREVQALLARTFGSVVR